MRFDPEDFAFTALYDAKRLSGEVKSLGKQALMRLIAVAVSAIVVVIIWSSGGRLAPTAWFRITQVSAIALVAVLVVMAIVVVVLKFTSAGGRTGPNTGLLTLLLILDGVLLFPVVLQSVFVNGYAETVQGFIAGLNDVDTIAAAKPLLSALTTAHTWLLIGLAVGAIAVVAGVAALMIWVRTPRSLGWRPRKLIQVALWTPPVLFTLSAAWMVLLSRRLVPQAQRRAGDDIVVPDAVILDDWLIWLLMAGMVITLITLAHAASRTAIAAILLGRMPQGPALRVDPLGMVIDDDTIGPQRLIWPTIDLIAGRARQALPGPELVIGRSGQSVWTVPFMFLNVMPGTIDSAVRAHTQNRRDLDLSAMDKVF